MAVHKLRSPRSCLRRIFVGLWSDIPAADHGFANALIEALAVTPPEMVKSNELLLQLESFLANLIRESLSLKCQHLMKNDLLPQLFWMAFDGFVISRHLGTRRDIPALAAAMKDLMLRTEH